MKREKGKMKMAINFALKGKKYHRYYFVDTTLQLNKWITIDLSQTKVGDAYQYKVEINGKVSTIIKKVIPPKEIQSLKIFVSNQWYKALPGYVRNVYIKGNVPFTLFVCVFLYTYKTTTKGQYK